jgi:acetyltransferase-like isoleucine patch superfamily enzyme
MNKLDLSEYPNAAIGKNVEIHCENFSYDSHFTIEDDVYIKAKNISLGKNCKIQKQTRVSSLRDILESFSMGDESLIGFNSQILVPFFSMGDYSQIFNNALVSGYKPVTLGHNCWVGQMAILNSAETLTIGNNVRMGGNNQIWTHVASGELLEGSTFNSEKPITIEDNVWMMGFGHTVSPGVTIARNCVIMSGSVVSKSTEPFKTYSGIPAKDITDKLPAWKTLTPDEKFSLLEKFVNEFQEAFPQFKDKVFIADGETKEGKNLIERISTDTEILLFVKKINLKNYKNFPGSVFDLNTKYYLKRKTEIEVAWMKFSIGYRARFIPYL